MHYACAIATLLQKRFETFSLDRKIVCVGFFIGICVCMFLAMSFLPRNKLFTYSKTYYPQ